MTKRKDDYRASDAAKELIRERLLLRRMEEKGLTHRQAERLFDEARRNAPVGEVVTGWAGVVT